jgi:hypothetical protein
MKLVAANIGFSGWVITQLGSSNGTLPVIKFNTSVALSTVNKLTLPIVSCLI